MITLRKIPRAGGREYLDRRGFGDQEKQVETDLGTNTWRVRLHHFLGGDDAGHHNHPFKWCFSIVLWGSYTEEILIPCGWHQDFPTWQTFCGQCLGGECRTVTRRVRFFNWIPWGKYHRITELHGDVWTLFITGPRVSSWGFWVPGRGHVHHEVYKAEKKQ